MNLRARALMLVSVLLGAPALLAMACSSGQAVECHVGADCASGACDVSGKCVSASSIDSGVAVKDSGSLGDGAQPEGAPSFDSSAFDAPVPGCTPNNDGMITSAEVPLVAGLHATFRIAENVPVSTAGTMQPDGSRVWDLTAALSGDHDVLVETLSPIGAWYASSFANATYATPLSDTSTLLGVFQANTSAVLLQGVVSPTSASPQTELTYAPAVPSLKFPLKLNDTWQTMSTVTGTASGIQSVYTEAYTTTVDATGQLKTPYGAFAVMRVHTVLTRTIGVVVTITRSDAFVAECFGPIASIVSTTDETNDEFTNAAEVRRLAP